MSELWRRLRAQSGRDRSDLRIAGTSYAPYMSGWRKLGAFPIASRKTRRPAGCLVCRNGSIYRASD
jgi:hypothetical protein